MTAEYTSSVRWPSAAARLAQGASNDLIDESGGGRKRHRHLDFRPAPLEAENQVESRDVLLAHKAFHALDRRLPLVKQVHA